ARGVVLQVDGELRRVRVEAHAQQAVVVARGGQQLFGEGHGPILGGGSAVLLPAGRCGPLRCAPMHAISRQHLVLLVALTLVWGINWPIMKVGIMGYQPLTFRVLSMWIGLPVLGLVLVWRRVPFRIAREHWAALGWLTVFNMLFWH